MAGTKAGGLKARDKNLANDPDFYNKLGKRGAAAYSAKDPLTRPPRGFAADRELAVRAGKIGGFKSRRGPTKQKVTA